MTHTLAAPALSLPHQVAELRGHCARAASRIGTVCQADLGASPVQQEALALAWDLAAECLSEALAAERAGSLERLRTCRAVLQELEKQIRTLPSA